MDQTDAQPHPQADPETACETAYETDAKWLSFRELAAVRGISKASAQSLIRRHGWRRQRDNRGMVKALVPLVWLTPQSDSETPAPTTGQADTSLMARGLAALEAAVMSLTARAEVAEAGRDAERRRGDDLRDQIGVLNTEMMVMRAESDARIEALTVQLQALQAQIADARAADDTATAERTRADELRASLDQAKGDARTARLEAVKLREADAERRARGLLARLGAALRGR